ncbi:MAG: c-type cytochrome domain-containing protein, partial [Planctomycetota bacterium]
MLFCCRNFLFGVLSSVIIVSGLQADDVLWSTQAAPILQKYCVGCHNRVETQHGLSLQSADDILKGDDAGAVLNLKTPAEGRLLTVLIGHGDDHMPPADQPQLSPSELKLLQQWILSGAKFDRQTATLPALPSIPVRAKKLRNPALACAMTG